MKKEHRLVVCFDGDNPLTDLLAKGIIGKPEIRESDSDLWTAAQKHLVRQMIGLHKDYGRAGENVGIADVVDLTRLESDYPFPKNVTHAVYSGMSY